ncbi:7760_t:CDS:2, partial [Gigaspora rosea]
TIELYDWAEHKVVRKKTISEKEEYLIGLMELTRPIVFTKNEDTDVIEATPTGDSSRKRIHNDLNEVDLGKDALRKEIKEIILLNECRTLDYGLEEHLTKKKTEHI